MFKTRWWLFPFIYLLSIWLVFVLQQHYGIEDIFALYPRDRAHMIGILTTPFLHGNLLHIASNSLPLAVSLIGLFYFYKDIAMRVMAICHIATGLGMWLFARPAFHIGASGVVYALVMFLLTSGFIRNNKQLKFLALAVLSIQSGLIWGIVPQGDNISWEGHLIGAVVGIITAIAFRNKGPLPDKKFQWNDEDDPFGNNDGSDEYSQFGG